MVITHFKPNEFFDFLKENGCIEYSNEHVQKDNIITYSKGEMRVPIQIRKSYYPSYVCKICEYFDIDPPEEFFLVKKQIEKLYGIDNDKKK